MSTLTSCTLIQTGSDACTFPSQQLLLRNNKRKIERDKCYFDWSHMQLCLLRCQGKNPPKIWSSVKRITPQKSRLDSRSGQNRSQEQWAEWSHSHRLHNAANNRTVFIFLSSLLFPVERSDLLLAVWLNSCSECNKKWQKMDCMATCVQWNMSIRYSVEPDYYRRRLAFPEIQ